MIKFDAVSVTKDGESMSVVQRVHIQQSLPKGICGSRIHYGSAKELRSATCHLQPGHEYEYRPGHEYRPDHRYKEDRQPSMLVAKRAVMAKFKGQKPCWIGWYDSTLTLNNSCDVELVHDGRKYVGR